MCGLVVIMCLVALVAGVPTEGDISSDLNEFLDLVPIDDIIGLTLRYFQTDKEVQASYDYLRSDTFRTVWEHFFEIVEVRNLLNYIDNAGLPVYGWLNSFASLLNLEPVHRTRAVRNVSTGGFDQLFNDVLALLPKDKIRALKEEKLRVSVPFRSMIEKLQHEDLKELVASFKNSAEVRIVLQQLRTKGLDLNKLVALVKAVLGFNDVA